MESRATSQWLEELAVIRDAVKIETVESTRKFFPENTQAERKVSGDGREKARGKTIEEAAP